ncbi:MAG TPA: hypothetical protein VIH90_04325 [Candidatus Saccharimonadales bacterium]
MNYSSNAKLIKLAHNLGAHDPIQSCTGGWDSIVSTDGYKEYVIRIPGSGIQQVEVLGCPNRPLTDQSNGQKVRFVHEAFKNPGTITGYYSPEGAKCSGGDIDIILTAQNSKQQDEIYLVYKAR